MKSLTTYKNIYYMYINPIIIYALFLKREKVCKSTETHRYWKIVRDLNLQKYRMKLAGIDRNGV